MPELNHTARMLPVTVDTWEIRRILLGTEEETERIPLEFPGPVQILGIHPTIAEAGEEDVNLVQPTLDDILVLIDINQQRRITNTLARAQDTGRETSYVTLSALATQFRWMGLIIDNAKPDMGVTFRWKFLGTALPVFRNAFCALSFYVKPWEGGR